MKTLTMDNAAGKMHLGRRMLDTLYDISAWLAALSMIGLLVMVLLAIIIRQIGVNINGIDAYAGYSMAAAGFLALAPTLKKNEHIRVTLFTARLAGATERGMEIWALAMGLLIACVFAYFSIRQAWVSYDIHDVSSGNDATPLWIPQLTMAVGTVILLIALLDELILELQGRRIQIVNEEGLRNE